MGTIETIKKFIESGSVIERAVTEALERLPLSLRYGISYGPTFRYWIAFLKESEQWDRDRLEAYQIEQLRALLKHAGENVPYYKKTFDEYGFRPKRIQSFDDIKALPHIDRKTVKNNPREFMAANIPGDRLIPANTSGTSGMPLTVYGTKETEEKHWATIVNLWSRAGYTPSSRTVFFEANIRLGRKENLPWKRYANKLIISSNYFTDKWFDKYIEMINDFRPEYLIGFPHTIAVFSSYIRHKGLSAFDGLRAVITYAENVYAWQRDIIMKIFGVRVFADYGMVEKAVHGGGCEHTDAYHLYSQYGFTEFLHIQDSMYELTGTGFINYAMPLIRYRTGDVCAEINKGCPDCGRDYDVVSRIEGRTGDFLINLVGQIVSVNLSIDINVLKNVKKFQLHQEYAGKVELRIWPEKDSYKDRDTDNILNEIKRSFGLHADRIDFNAALMDDKGSQSSKKYRMVDQSLEIRDFF